MSSGAFFHCKFHETGIAELCLARAPVNALTAEMLSALTREIDALSANDDVRAIVFTSDFKVFSAGLDLREAQNFDLTQQRDIVEGLNTGFHALFACPKPTVVAINGAAIAGGAFFVFASDYRIANDRASIGLAEVRVGADFPLGPLEIARAMLSPNDLRRLMLTGQPMTAAQALTSGIFDEVVDAADLRAAAIKAAQKLAEIPRETYARVKRQTRGAVIDQIETGMAQGANRPEGGWFNDETRAAMAAMIG
jgi:enoyl-CoA hydratase/carnithine racemase